MSPLGRHRPEADVLRQATDSPQGLSVSGLSPNGEFPHGGTECRGSRSACADLDGTKASRVSRLATRSAKGAQGGAT
jgi:hypothetical protein